MLSKVEPLVKTSRMRHPTRGEGRGHPPGVGAEGGTEVGDVPDRGWTSVSPEAENGDRSRGRDGTGGRLLSHLSPWSGTEVGDVPGRGWTSVTPSLKVGDSGNLEVVA